MEKADVLKIVKSMLDSELPEEIIVETLRQDLGLKDSEIQAALREAKGIAEPQASVQKTAETVPIRTAPDEEFRELHETATQNILQNHGDSIEDVKGSVQGLHEKIDSFKEQAVMPSAELVGKINSLQSRIDSLSMDVKELKAGTNGLVELLKKILETDRNVLMHLERKK